VVALDSDRAALEAARTNAKVNQVSVDVRRFDLRAERLSELEGATVAANLLAPLLTRWATDLAAGAGLPRRIIASGLLSEQAEDVAAAFAKAGLREAARLDRDGWAALALD
jgi:ribosomal protein L11 methyltransferase